MGSPPRNPQNALGALLRQRRAAAGLTQEALGTKVGLSARAIGLIERGASRAVSAATLDGLCSALGLSPTDRAALFAAACDGAAQPSARRPVQRTVAGGTAAKSASAATVAPARGSSASEGRIGRTAATPVRTGMATRTTTATRVGGPPSGDNEDAAESEVRTFLIADIRGYTRFTQERGDEAGARLAMKFARIARAIVEAHGGKVMGFRGDEIAVDFVSPRDALRAAVEMQTRFAEETLRDPGFPMRVGAGLDVGEVIKVEDNYRGGAINMASRLCSLAGAGEVLITTGLAQLARAVDGLVSIERGQAQLKGFTDPVSVWRAVREADAASARAAIANQPALLKDDAAGKAQWVGGTTSSLDAAGEADGGMPATGREVVEAPLPHGGYLGALPDGPLVARESELGRLLDALDAAEAGSARLMLLAGEPGIGKTRLTQELMLNARERHFLLATGRCYEQYETAPYYPFLEALTKAYAAAPAAIRTELPRRWPDVARLLPDQHVGVPAQPSGSNRGQEEQQRLFWGVSGFLLALAEVHPVALLLDDLHWADGASVELLAHLARHTVGHRVLLVGAYRDMEVRRQQPLDVLLRTLGREHLVERIPVRRLTIAETAALMAATLHNEIVAPELATLLHERTDGNPFFLQEVLRTLVERGDVYWQGGRWEPRAVDELEVPESVRAVIDERLARLTPEAQELLHEASVFGQTFGFDELLATTDRGEEEVEEALTAATAAALIRETGGDGYAFNHALTQRTLYLELTARKRRRLHRAAGEALNQLPERIRARQSAAIARHFLAGDDAVRALPYLLQAGDQAEAVFAHVEAERQYQTALERSRDLGQAAIEAQALEKLGAVYLTTARYDTARESLGGAATLYRALGDEEAVARTTAQIGWVHAYQGTPDAGIALLEPLRTPEREHSLSPATRAALAVALAQLCQISGRYAEQLEEAERGARLAREARQDRLLAQAEVRRASALILMGRLREAGEVLSQALALLEATGDARSLCFALNVLGGIREEGGQHEESRDYFERAIEAAERLGDPALLGSITSNRGGHAFKTGDWAEARDYFERAIALVRRVGASWASPYPLNAFGQLCLAQGQTETGVEQVRESEAIAERSGDLQALQLAASTLAERDLVEERPAEARDRLEPLLHRGGEEADVTLILAPLAWAYAELGAAERAAGLLDRALAHLPSEGGGFDLADVRRVQGILATHQQRWPDAEEALRQALTLTREMRFPYLEAKVLYAIALLHARRGQPDCALEPLRAALDILGRLGERLYAAPAERLLARLGQPDA